jgi:hypothetical protein
MDEIRKLASIECGEDAAKHFSFDKGYRNLNHGTSDVELDARARNSIDQRKQASLVISKANVKIY